MAFPKKLKELCTPAFLYFTLSMLALLVSVFQNLGNSRRFNLGMLSARVPSTLLVFVVNLIYILFWTWVLNLMCKDGHKEIAWFLVLIPFILLFLVMGSMMGGSVYEGFQDLGQDLECPEGLEVNPNYNASETESDTNMRCIRKIVAKEGFYTTEPTTEQQLANEYEISQGRGYKRPSDAQLPPPMQEEFRGRR